MCFLMDIGPLLIDFLLQHAMAEVAKTVDSFLFFIVFAIFIVGLLGLFFD